MLKKLENLLKKNKIFYQTIQHKTVYTTFDLHQTTGIALKEIGKTLLVKADKEFFLTVISGNRKLDLIKLKNLLNKALVKTANARGEQFKKIKKLKIGSEIQIKRNFTKKIGALLPLGSFYKKRTIVDKLFLKNKKIILRAGDFKESIKMTTKNFVKLENPIIGSISKP